MLVVYSALCFRVHSLNFCIYQITHDIDIMCCKIECYANIAYTGRKGTESPSMQVKNLTELTSNETSLHLYNRWVEPFDMPYGELSTTKAGEFDQCGCFIDGTRHRFFNEYIDALIKQK